MLDQLYIQQQAATPLDFFQILVKKNALNSWRYDYLTDGAELDVEVMDTSPNKIIDVNFEVGEKTKLEFNSAIDDFEPVKYSFLQDMLVPRLRIAEEHAFGKIRSYLYSQDIAAEEKELYIKRIIIELEGIKVEANKNDDLVYFPIVKSSISNLLDSIKASYKPELTKVEVKTAGAVKSTFTLKNKSAKPKDSLFHLFESLTAEGQFPFLDPKTEWLDFKAVFTGGLIKNKLVWVGPLGDLRFLILELLKSEKVQNMEGNHWQNASNCFSHRDKDTNEIISIPADRISKADHAKNELNLRKWRLITQWVDEIT